MHAHHWKYKQITRIFSRKRNNIYAVLMINSISYLEENHRVRGIVPTDLTKAYQMFFVAHYQYPEPTLLRGRVDGTWKCLSAYFVSVPLIRFAKVKLYTCCRLLDFAWSLFSITKVSTWFTISTTCKIRKTCKYI